MTTITRLFFMREKQIEEKLRDEVKKLGGLALKFVSPGTSGVFDRIVLLPDGKIWFVEVKKPGEILSPLQQVFEKKLIRFSMRYRVIDDMTQVDKFINDLRDDL